MVPADLERCHGGIDKTASRAIPLELAERLVRMFSFVGDTVLDPFMGTGTTTVAAAKWGRNSIGFEIDRHYYKLAQKRISEETSSLFSTATINSIHSS